MAEFTIYNAEDGFGKCSECDMNYCVIFSRNPVYLRFHHCPFCGEEIEDIRSECSEDVE